MTRYFLGVDIGATKSHALVADEFGQSLGRGVAGPGNYEVVGYNGLREVLNTITNAALKEASINKCKLSGAGFGIAGYDWPAEHDLTLNAIQSLKLDAPFDFVNDIMVGLIAGSSTGWGVAVGAGTSNNCWGRAQDGRLGRMTGCGPWFGEFGGAGEVVGKAIQYIAKAWTMRSPPTQLTEAFIDLTGAKDTMDLLEGLALERYRVGPAAAPLVFQVAANGDKIAQETIQWAGRELGSLAIGVIRQLGFEELEFEVVLSGSLFKGSPMLRETMQSTIHEIAQKAKLVRLTAPPVVGGVLLGMEKAGLNYHPVREKLIAKTLPLFQED